MKEAAERVIELTEKDKSRFWAKVDRSGGPDACWLWTAAKRKTGYGLFYIRRAHGSHRIAWAMDKGPIPDGLCVCHRCDNPPCCNPKHLYAGTKVDNAQDSIRAGTKYQPDNRGELHGMSKLTAKDILEIRTSKLSQRKTANLFGVSQSSIWLIKTNKRWTHI